MYKFIYILYEVGIRNYKRLTLLRLGMFLLQVKITVLTVQVPNLVKH